MGFSAPLVDYINAYVRQNIEEKINSSFIQLNGLLYFLAGQSLETKGAFGQPNFSQVYGTGGMGQAERRTAMGDIDHLFRYQKAQIIDGSTVQYGGATPVASAYSEDNVETAGTRWTMNKEPFKIRRASLDATKGSRLAIGNLIDESVMMKTNSLLVTLNQQFWSGTLTATQQEQILWSNYLGLTHTLTANNTYARKDRSVTTYLNPLSINASTQLASTTVDLNIDRFVNVGGTFVAGQPIRGLTRRSVGGKGASLFITTPELWQSLALQADGVAQIFTNGIPEHAISGFKMPVIQRGSVYYISDEFCPAGEMYGLNLDTWMYEVHAKYNFKVPSADEWTLESKVVQGGADIFFASIEHQARLTCRQPWSNCRIYGLVA